MNKNPCYEFCNQKWDISQPSMRLYCKKGCDGDGDTMAECKTDFCSGLCIKDALGEDDDKKAGWTKFFARAPMKSDECLESCIAGCSRRPEEDD